MPDDVESVVALGRRIEGVLKTIKVGGIGNVNPIGGAPVSEVLDPLDVNVNSIGDAPVAVVLDPLDVMLVVAVKTEPVCSSPETVEAAVADNGTLNAPISGTEVAIAVEVDPIEVPGTSVLLTIAEAVVIPIVRLPDDGARSFYSNSGINDCHLKSLFENICLLNLVIHISIVN